MRSFLKWSRLKWSSIALTVLIAMPCGAQGAADYPNRPVTLVVPFAAGGPTDTLGRLVAQKLSERLGKQFIIENKAGAGGNTGSAQVARATPDGYTLVLGTVSTHGINPSLYRNMPYDHKKILPRSRSSAWSQASSSSTKMSR